MITNRSKNKTRVVKVGHNPWANLAHQWFESDWVEIFLQISIQVNF